MTIAAGSQAIQREVRFQSTYASSKQTIDSTKRVEFIVNKLVKYQRKRNGAFRFFDLKGDSPIVNRNYLIQRGYDEFSKFFDVTASSDILSITSDLTEDQAQKFVDFDVTIFYSVLSNL